MIKLIINNTLVEVANGLTLMEASAINGFEIPSMCHNGNIEHFTSCMICLVKEKPTGRFIPSCSEKAVEGMDIVTNDEEIVEARRTALELLLSEHVGDCKAPCRIACPASMNIPEMNRLIAANKTGEAIELVMNDIALPGVLGFICPAPCEGACKRKPIDQAVSICLLKRFAALNSNSFARKEILPDTGKKAAIIGAGPAGLAASYYLQLKGIKSFVFDRNELPGGNLRYKISDEKLNKDVLNKDINIIKETGVVFTQNQVVDSGLFKKLRQDYNVVVLATGNYSEEMSDWGVENNGKHFLINKTNFLTNLNGVFAIGNSNRSAQLAIRSSAQGKEVAVAIEQLLNGKPVEGIVRQFNSSVGKLLQEEYAEYLKEGTTDKRQYPEIGDSFGFGSIQAQIEAARCLHCDCRKSDSCKLRIYSNEYNVSKKRFNYSVRKQLKKIYPHELVVFEPQKCIKCGLCVRHTARHNEKFGFTFIGRGFDVEIGVPFNESLGKSFEKIAYLVAEACPTGALALRTTIIN